MNRPRLCWAPPRIRPKVAAQLIREYIYLYGAVCPKDDHAVVPQTDMATVKAKARRAWLDSKAKAANIVPPTIADRIWANGLLAVAAAPPRVQVTMLHRLEVVFVLLADQARWGEYEERAQAQQPPRGHRGHGGKRSSWDHP